VSLAAGNGLRALALGLVFAAQGVGCDGGVEGRTGEDESAGTVLSGEHVGSRPLPADAELRRDPDWGTVRFLKGDNLSASLESDWDFRAHQAAGRAEEIVFEFLEAYASALGFRAPRTELRVRSSSTDQLGLTHLKLEQSYAGLPMPGSELIVHLDGENHVYLLTGSYAPTPGDVSTAPKIGEDEARTRAKEQVEGAGDKSDRACELVIFVERGSPARLAYRVGVEVGLTEGWEIMIDAHTGDPLRKLPTVLSRSPSGGIGVVIPSPEARPAK